MNFLYNPWFIGIGGGIVSSLIVFFVTRAISNRKGNKEYLQRIKTANNEILYSVRPLVIDKRIPTSEIISAIRSSVSRRYGVRIEDLITDQSLYNDLVSEIMTNAFLSSEQKNEFCDLLKPTKANNPGVVEYIEKFSIQEKNYAVSRYVSMLLAIISFAMVLVATWFSTRVDTRTFNKVEDNVILVALSTITPILTMIAMMFYIGKSDKSDQK